MKNKKFKKSTRYLLALGLVSIVAASALSATTYAWFVANRTVGGSIGEFSADTVGELAVSLDATNGDDGNWSDTFDFTMDAGLSFSDISGNGLKLYKPVISADSFSAGTVTFTKVNEVVSSTGYYYDMSVSFRSYDPLTIYLGSGTTVESTGGTDYAKALRIAFLNSSKDRVTNIFTSQTDTLQYIPEDKAGGTNAEASTFYSELTSEAAGGATILQGAVVDRVLNEDANNPEGVGAPLVVLSKDGDDATYYYGNITVRYWIEGTDANCINSNILNSISATLEFHGLEPDTI